MKISDQWMCSANDEERAVSYGGGDVMDRTRFGVERCPKNPKWLKAVGLAGRICTCKAFPGVWPVGAGLFQYVGFPGLCFRSNSLVIKKSAV